jgi:hypothetical protein
MFEFLHNWLRQVRTEHGVNPIIFAVIYFTGILPFWLAIYKILRAIKNRNYAQAGTFGIVLGIVIIAPFAYVALFGHDLPAWFWIVTIAVIAYTVYSVIVRVKRART